MSKHDFNNTGIGFCGNSSNHQVPLDVASCIQNLHIDGFYQERTPYNSYGYRTRLPVGMKPRNEFKIWDILKNCIGKELTKISIPVMFNEPLSFLQRMGEYLEYSHLLFQAAYADDPTHRLEFISAFAISAVSSNWERLGKPFNPLLGETFELDRMADRGYQMICEQVSHHPPTSAFHVESVDGSWRFHGAITPKLSFMGKAVDVNPKGYVTLELLKRNEVYTWHNAQCRIHNILIGKLWVEHFGDMTIINHSNGYKAELEWQEASWFSSDYHNVSGYIYNDKKEKVKALYGKWIDSVFSVSVERWKEQKQSNSVLKKRHASSLLSAGSVKSKDESHSGGHSPAENDSDEVFAPSRGLETDLQLPGQTRLWKVLHRPEEAEKYYCFSYFAMTLNDLCNPEFMSSLPPTDCRKRPDMRALENGQLDLAQSEKERLEEKQREARKRIHQNSKKVSEAVWFKLWKNPYTKKEYDWRFNGEYWNRDWKNCPDIF